MTDFEIKEMYKDFNKWTWLDAFMVVVLFIGALMGFVLFGFVIGIGMELARGLF